jgi:uncharacterized membrane protein
VRRRVDLTWLLALGSALLATVGYAAASIERHERFGSNAFDLGIYDQTIWGYSRFHAAWDNTVLETPNLLGNHFQPILVALAPLYWVWDDVRVLLVAQAVFLAAASLPLFAWARAELGRWPALVFQAGYLVYWPVLAGALYDFHDTALAAPAISLAVFGLVTRRFALVLAGSVLALLTREELALTVAVIAVYAAAVGLRRRESLALAAASVAWLVVAVKALIPWFSGSAYVHWFYPALGSGPGSALVHVVTHPIDTVRLFFSPHAKRVALANLLAPWLLLPLLSPLALLALPNLAARFLSDKPSYWSQGFHYSLMIAPVLAFAAVDAVRRLAPHVSWRFFPLALGCLALLVGAYWNFRRLQPLAELDRLPPQSVAAEMQRCLDRIPPDASVAATSALVPHLAHRRRIELLDSTRLPDTDVIAVDRYTWLFPLRPEDVATIVREARRRGYTTVCRAAGTTVLTTASASSSVSSG